MAATQLSAGAGPDTLVLKISQDAYQGSAQYRVLVDGKQVGGTFTASALRSRGEADTLTMKGDWGPGAHDVEVEFLNDAWGGTAAADRNLYIRGATYNGEAVSGAAQEVKTSSTVADFTFTDAAPPAFPPVSLTAGSGPDSLVLKISQDHHQGSAQYQVLVDGKQIGGTFTASALKSSGQSDTLTLKGDWAAGDHKVEVKFLNDAWGGTAATDRNLFVDGATYNGGAVPGAAKALMGAGAQSFAFEEAARFATLTAGSGPDALVLKLSQDAYQGSAQYRVFVDGEQVGGTFDAVALRGSGVSDTLTLKGDWGPGAHEVEVEFLNDAYGGSASTDRNLFVEGAAYNGEAVAGAAKDLMAAGPAGFAFTEAGEPGGGGGGQFRETFFDGFDGAAVDRSKWTITYGGDAMYWNGAFRWDNRMLSVSDGNLNIGLERQGDGIWETSGLATTPTDWAPGFSMTHGKVEIRAKASQEVDGAGPCFLLWPATNDHWPPEVDILETPHGDGMFTNHWAGPNGEDTFESKFFDLDYTQWHVYGLEWTPDRLTMTVDGEVMGEITGNIPTEAMSIGLQGHVGGADDSWYGNANATGVDRVDIAVDYVRAYEYSPLG